MSRGTAFPTINVKKIAFGNKAHITDYKMEESVFIETLHKQ